MILAISYFGVIDKASGLVWINLWALNLWVGSISRSLRGSVGHFFSGMEKKSRCLLYNERNRASWQCRKVCLSPFIRSASAERIIVGNSVSKRSG